MDSHLIAVKVSIESGANQWVKLDGITLDKYRLEGLNTQTVESGSTIEQNVFTANNFFKDSPNFRNSVFDKTASPRDIIGKFALQELRDNKWLEKFKSHVFWKTALMKL